MELLMNGTNIKKEEKGSLISLGRTPGEHIGEKDRFVPSVGHSCRHPVKQICNVIILIIIKMNK